MRKSALLLGAAFVCAFAAAAAADTVITVPQPTGGVSTYPFAVFQDAAGNDFSKMGLCGILCNHQADVWGDGGLGSHVLNWPASFNVLGSTGAAVDTAIGTPSNRAVGIQGALPAVPAPVIGPTVTAGQLKMGVTAVMTGVASTPLIGAQAGARIYLTSGHCNNSSATVGTFVDILDGSSGAVLDRWAAGVNYGGDNRSGGTLPLFWTTVGNGLYAQDETTGAAVSCQASGYAE